MRKDIYTFIKKDSTKNYQSDLIYENSLFFSKKNNFFIIGIIIAYI